MSDPRRFVQWEQPAGRHTQLIDPVISVQQLGGRFEVFRKLQSRVDHALVFATTKGGYVAFLPPDRPGNTRGYTAAYEVDMRVHHVAADIRLPSDNDAYEFTVAVEINWRVEDPARFVAGGHRDVPRLLLGELERTARPVARGFGIAQSADAEAELLRVLPAATPLGSENGIHTTWTVRLRRDQENIDHQLRLQAIRHDSTENILTEELGMAYDVRLDERARQQDALTAGRAMAYGGAQHELALQQQQWQHQQRIELSRQQAELQRVEAEKIAFYQWHLQQGGVHAWAMHLAQHPEDSALVMRTMREDQLQLIRDQMQLVGQLLTDGGAERHELEGPKQLALRAVNDILNQRLPGVPHDPPPPYEAQPTPAIPGAPQPPYGAPAQTPYAAPHQPPGQPTPGPTIPHTPYGPPAETPASQAPYAASPQPPGQPAPTQPPGAPTPGPTAPQAPYDPGHTPYAPYAAPPQPPGQPAPAQPAGAPAGPPPTFAQWEPPPGYGAVPFQGPAPEPGPESRTEPGADGTEQQ
ncbi:hypothetical protein [Streptomyces sp. NPDC091371]|uniref:hypothetical protein n=1 Tax=Streptomyces sp. NPDC091371 TaxID=3155303 RepID=UPI00342D6FF3